MYHLFRVNCSWRNLLGPPSFGIFVLLITGTPMQGRISPYITTCHSIAWIFLVATYLNHVNFSRFGPISIWIISRQKPQCYSWENKF
jgi:hypothetical protein